MKTIFNNKWNGDVAPLNINIIHLSREIRPSNEIKLV